LAKRCGGASGYDEAVPLARRAVRAGAATIRARSCCSATRFRRSRSSRSRRRVSPRDAARSNNLRRPSNLALTLLKMGRATEALAMYDEVCARWPNSADAVATTFAALSDAGRLRARICRLRSALATPSVANIQFRQPRWTARTRAGKTIL
jgi:hypothetical protein